MTAEQVCFPHAAQAAVIRRKSGTRRRETVYLLTSREAERFSADAWLRANRHGWGIENGLHQRLDVTAQEDRCRVRSRNGAWVLGMFRRTAISLFAEWRIRNPARAHRSTFGDFLARMADDNHRLGFTLLNSLNPSLSYRLS